MAMELCGRLVGEREVASVGRSAVTHEHILRMGVIFSESGALADAVRAASASLVWR